MPNNAILVIAGDVKPDKALAQVKEFFGDIPSAKLPPAPNFNFQPVQSETQKLDTDLPYGLVALTYRFPGSDSADYAAAQILSDVLSSQREKLYGLVPEGKAIFAGFSYEGMQKFGLGYAVAASSRRSRFRAPRAASPRHSRGGNYQRGHRRPRRSRQTPRDCQRRISKNSVSGLAMAWSQAVAGEGRQSPDDDIAAIRRVTVADVNRVAKSFIDFDHFRHRHFDAPAFRQQTHLFQELWR